MNKKIAIEMFHHSSVLYSYIYLKPKSLGHTFDRSSHRVLHTMRLLSIITYPTLGTSASTWQRCRPVTTEVDVWCHCSIGADNLLEAFNPSAFFPPRRDGQSYAQEERDEDQTPHVVNLDVCRILRLQS
eukprot:GFUD01032605.1.p1 GENE.GFUD01032605.1~~GFUD01032605.1.p1  ORF type:complete len:129 (+),score=13.67 GFUD01032605.1:60-446(+)